MKVDARQGQNRLRRLLFAALGIVCVVLGAIGVVVPGLPTTVFVIAASYCFCRSFPSLDQRLRNNRWLGAPLKKFEATRAMSMRAKCAALSSMWLGIGLGLTLVSGRGMALPATMLVAGLIGSGVILFWVRTADRPRHSLRA